MLENVVSKLCRCCMKNGDLNIFSTLFESLSIAKILEQIFTEQISSGDRLPKTICRQCFNKAISQFLFVKKYRKVQVLLLEILKGEHETNSLLDDENKTFSNEFESSDDDQPLSNLYNKQKRSSEGSADDCGKIDLDEDVSKQQNLNLFECESYEKILEEKQDFYPCCSKDLQGEELSSCKDCSTLKTTNHCQHLRDSYEVKKDIDKHSQSSEKEINISVLKHSCNDCSQSFELMKLLEKHCKDSGHIYPRKFVCGICSKKFVSNTRLNDHMRIHNNERPFACNECGMTFTLSSNLKRHKKRHTGEKSYFCEICGKGFIQKHTLTVHMRLHNGETPYVCELCGKGYRAKPLLHQHMYKHKDTKTQTIKYQKYYLKYGKVKVECKECKKIITKSALYNHMKVQHGDGLKKFLCNLCGKTYATRMSLDVHMNIHTKKISYDCNICSKSFTHQNYLKTHLMLHSGERPHCCDLCGKTFVQRTHLDRHKKTHTGARPYACSYCDKAFALNENLKVHIRIHTRETPHYCSECGKGFFNSSSKKKHETSVHRK